MFCTNCGKENPDTNKFCLQCGQTLAAGAASGAAGPGAAASPAAQTPPRRSPGRLPLILGGVVLLVALAAAAYFLLPIITGSRGGGGGREMLLVTPNRDGDVDLSVLRLGDDPEEAVVIAEDVTASSNVYLLDYGDSGEDVRGLPGPYGSFLPGDDRLVAFYTKDGEARLVEYALGAEAATEIVSGEDATFSGGFLPQSGDLFIRELADSGDDRCHVAAPGAEAERVERGDSCSLTGDRARVTNEEYNSAGEVTLTVADLDGANKVTLLEDVAALDVFTSADASHVAYLSDTDDGRSLVLRDADGEELFESDEFNEIRGYGFVGQSDTLYFIGDNGEGEYELHTSTGGGPVATAPALIFLWASDGNTLAVLTADEDGAGEVSVVDLATGESVEIASGDNLTMGQVADPPRLLVREEVDGDLTLTAFEWSGANPVPLFDDSDYSLNSSLAVPGDNRVLLNLRSEGLNSLYVAPLDSSPGYFILEEWDTFQVFDQKGDTLLLAGREDPGDDETLYAVTLAPDADLVELDDSGDRYDSAVIDPDGRSAIYNATVGPNYDDVVVRQVQLDGEEQSVDLFEEMSLAAARWSLLKHVNIFFLDAGEVAPSAEPVFEGVDGANLEEITADFVYSGRIDQESFYDLGNANSTGYGKIYYFDGIQGQRVQFDVYGGASLSGSSLDPVAELRDSSMNILYTDDDSGSGTDSRITYTLPRDGRYFLIVRSLDRGFADNYEYQVWMDLP